VKRGEHFNHTYWITPDRKPLECVVTRIAQGVIYYRPFYSKHDDGTDWLGASAYFSVEQAEKYVLEGACLHDFDTSGSNPSRGWHRAVCRKCGFDASVDSGD
jgi:hypothetical protein